MSTPTVCDKCGIIKKDDINWNEVMYKGEKWDLCPDCSDDFEFEWVNTRPWNKFSVALKAN